MLNLFQHLYFQETLKQVQGDFTLPEVRFLKSLIY